MNRKVILSSLVLLVGSLLYSASAYNLQPVIDRVHRDGLYELYVKELAKTDVKVVSYEELVSAAKGYQVVVIGGYSGLDYEDKAAVTKDLEVLAKKAGDHTMYVLGATIDGIGQAYKDLPAITRKLGYADIKMAGIVSRNAAEWGIEKQDYVVFVDTAPDDWNVIVGGKSLYIKIAADTKGTVVYFRGGAVSKNELGEAIADGLPVYVVVDASTLPNKKNVEKKLAKNANYVTDGTVDIVKDAAKWKNLTVIK